MHPYLLQKNVPELMDAVSLCIRLVCRKRFCIISKMMKMVATTLPVEVKQAGLYEPCEYLFFEFKVSPLTVPNMDDLFFCSSRFLHADIKVSCVYSYL